MSSMRSLLRYCGSRLPSLTGTRTGVSCCGCFPRGWTSILRRYRPCGAKRGIRMIELDLDDFRDDAVSLAQMVLVGDPGSGSPRFNLKPEKSVSSPSK